MCLKGFIGVLLLNSRGAPPFKFVLPVQVAPKTEISFSVLIKHLFSLRCLIKAGNYLYLSATCCLGHNRPTSVWTLALYLARPGGFEPPTPWFVAKCTERHNATVNQMLRVCKLCHRSQNRATLSA